VEQAMVDRVGRVVIPVVMVVVAALGLVGGPAGQAPSPFVTRNGTDLFLDGHVYRYTGTNAYELATLWSVNMGCGAQVDDLDAFFASLHSGSMVSFTATQAMAFNNKKTNAIDFTGIDRVVKAAERHDQRLEIALSGQAGFCDDYHWHDQAWYDSGYRQAFNDNGRNLARLSYWDYLHLIVPRYKDSKAVAIWEPVGEPEASNCPAGLVGPNCYGVHRACPPGAASSLRKFFDTVGAEIMTLDPNHLVSTGTLSRRQCGLSDGGYRTVLNSPYVDVASYHDYGSEATPLPLDLSNALREAHAVNKVFVMDEAGINAGIPCQTTAKRKDQFRAKMDAQFAAGLTGFEVWNWEPTSRRNCDFAIAADDPIMGLLRAYRLPG
jgi:mannan endo-1,4-beta-mannosidase